jgi:hypothetical protein
MKGRDGEIPASPLSRVLFESAEFFRRPWPAFGKCQSKLNRASQNYVAREICRPLEVVKVRRKLGSVAPIFVSAHQEGVWFGCPDELASGGRASLDAAPVAETVFSATDHTAANAAHYGMIWNSTHVSLFLRNQVRLSRIYLKVF